MEKIFKEQDSWGEYIIYVGKCKNFEKEDQNTPRNKEFYLHNPELERIDDIIYKVEDYFNNSREIDT